MKKIILMTAILVTMSAQAGNSGKALEYFDNCIDRMKCSNPQECYDKDTECAEITELLFYGKITDKEAEERVEALEIHDKM